MLGRVVGGNTIPPTTRPSHRPLDVRAGLRATPTLTSPDLSWFNPLVSIRGPELFSCLSCLSWFNTPLHSFRIH